jgi:hypothetical protein
MFGKKTSNMKSLSQIALGLGLMSISTACETVIDLPAPAHTPQLAASYILANRPTDGVGSSANGSFLAHRQLFISTSQGVFDTKQIRGRADATARIFAEDGTLVEEFVPGQPYFLNGIGGTSPDGYYRPTRGFVGQPGQTYRLRIEAPGVSALESRLTLPPTVATLRNASFTANSGGTFSFGGRATLIIQDDPATTDYYLAFAQVVDALGAPLGIQVREVMDDENGTGVTGDRLQLSDPDSYGGFGVIPFADAGLNGRAITFAADLEMSTFGGPPPGAQLEITISRITADAFRFWQSERRYVDTDGNPFAEPAPVFSNMTPGYGIFGGSVDTAIRLPL